MATENKTGARESQDEHAFGLSSTGWTPTSLRRSTLFAAAASSAIIAIILGCLKFFSDRNDGLCNAQTRDHYLWTYAPTAVFTIFAAAWTQIEYRAKQMQPWRSMGQGEKEAAEGILLDYMSPWNGLVLYRAAKRRHGVVVAAVAGSYLLQLLVILSTGLLTLSQVELHTSDVSLVVIDKFITNGADLKLSLVDQTPVVLVVAISKNMTEFPPGTTDTAAFQQFVPGNNHTGDIQWIKAEVDVLSSTMQCESAIVNARMHANYQRYKNTAAWFTTGFQSASYGKCVFSSWIPGPNYNAFLPMGLAYFDFSCSASKSSVSTQAPESPILLWFRTTDIDQAMPGTLCWPKYELKKLEVTTDGMSTSNILDQHSSKNSQQPDWKSEKIYNAFQRSLKLANVESSKMLYSDALNTRFSGLECTWLSMLNPQIPITDFEDPKVVATMFQKAWSAFTAQLFSLYFRQKANTPVEGVTITQRERLVIGTVSFWITQACLVMLFALSVALAVMNSYGHMMCDPSSITGLASILSASPDLMERLHETGVATEKQLIGVLSDGRFRAGVADPATTVIYSSELQADTGYYQIWHDSLRSRKIHWYRPFAASIGFVLATPILLIALILTLEVLLHGSQITNGLAYVSAPGSYEHYSWTFAPALTMVGITVLIGSQYKTVKLFLPYVALSTGAKSGRTVMRRPFSDFNLLQSFRNREVYVVASGVALLVGWFLAIVVSGLYSAVPVSSLRQVSLQQKDWFQYDITDSLPPSPQTPFQIDVVLNGNSSYPKFTYDTLALSKPQIPLGAVKGKLEVEALPAIRADMNCTLVANSDIVKIEILTAEEINDHSSHCRWL